MHDGAIINNQEQCKKCGGVHPSIQEMMKGALSSEIMNRIHELMREHTQDVRMALVVDEHGDVQFGSLMDTETTVRILRGVLDRVDRDRVRQLDDYPIGGYL